MICCPKVGFDRFLETYRKLKHMNDMSDPIARSLAISLPDLNIPAHLLTKDDDFGTRRNRSVIYTRYSTDAQTEDSTERQIAVCSDYEKRLGLTNVGRYDDQGVTGTTTEREELQRLLNDAERGRFSDVVFESLDRVARKLKVAVEICEALLDLGITIHDVEEGRALNIYDIGVKGSAAQSARDLLVKRAQNGKRRKAAQGTFGVASCFGYERVWVEETQTLVWQVKDSEAEILKEIFEMFASGISAQRICDILNARPPAERGFSHWMRCNLIGNREQGTGVLRRVRYAGIRIHGRMKITKVNGVRTVGVHPVKLWVYGKLDPKLIIIKKELFDKVQLMLNARAEAAQASRTLRYYKTKKSILVGLFQCAKCGGGMSASSNRGVSHLYCNRSRLRQEVRCGDMRGTRVEIVEDHVYNLLTENLAADEAIQKYVEIYNASAGQRVSAASGKKEALEQNRQRLEARMDKIRADEESARYPKDYLEKARIKVTEEYETVVRALSDANALGRSAPVTIDPSERLGAHRRLMSSLEHLFSDDFDRTSETGTKILAALRQLIHSITIDVDDDGRTITLKCRMVDPFDDCDANIATFSCRVGRYLKTWAPSSRETRRAIEAAEKGTYDLSDQEWLKIRHFFPDFYKATRLGGESISKRRIVDAVLLHLWEGMPINRLPACYGPPETVAAGLKHLSMSGGWDAVAAALREISPNKLPKEDFSAMFSTDPARHAPSMRGWPVIRARHGIEAEAGKHFPSNDVWREVSRFVPEAALQVDDGPACISRRRFLHGLLFWVCEGIEIAHMPLMFGTYKYFVKAIARLAGLGALDHLIAELQKCKPSPLAGANLGLLERFLRPTPDTPHVPENIRSIDPLPPHVPDIRLWALIEHLFPQELLYANNKHVIRSGGILAHAILYHLKEGTTWSSMPPFFGEHADLRRGVAAWVSHGLSDELFRLLDIHAPDAIEGMDRTAFNGYKRASQPKYRHLIGMAPPEPADHLPTEEDFLVFQDLMPLEMLEVRGRPAVMEPRKFFHAVVYMLKEHSVVRRLPPYFGDKYGLRLALRRFVAHHFWDTMRLRILRTQPKWALGADLTIFDASFPRSKHPHTYFKKRRNFRKSANAAQAVTVLDESSRRSRRTENDASIVVPSEQMGPT